MSEGAAVFAVDQRGEERQTEGIFLNENLYYEQCDFKQVPATAILDDALTETIDKSSL